MDIKTLKAQAVASVRHWRNNPQDWVKDKLPKVKLSTQQVRYFLELGKLIRAKIKAYEAPGTLNEEEKRYAAKIGVSITAGQGVGKDFVAALTIAYFLDVFPYSKITATGMTGKHLRNVLWAECSKILRLAALTNPDDPQSPTVLEQAIAWQSERMFHKGAKKPGAEWFAECVTINPNSTEDEQAKTLYGRHEDYQLVVVDEAANVPEPVFGPLEGTLTSKCAIALMIFNPTRAKGYAHDSQNSKADLWITDRWSAEESELVSKDHLEKMLRYGRDSNPYRVKVLGLPPSSATGGLIPYDAIMDAVNRDFEVSEFDPVMCGVDAGGGGDQSVVCMRQGAVAEFHEKQTPSRDDLIDWSRSTLQTGDATVAFVDNIGLGWDVYKDLRKDGLDARPADSRSTKDLREPERFFNKRAEMYWDMSEAFINRAISIPNHEDLINELGAIIRDDVGQKVKILDKKVIRTKLGFSPDHADALAMTFYKPDRLFRKGTKKKTRSVDLSGIFLR